MTTLNGEDSRYVSDIMECFFGASPEIISDDTASLAARLIYEAVETALAWDLVYDPPGFVPTSEWVLSEAVRSFWHEHGHEKIREAIRLAVAEKYQAEFDRIMGRG